MFLIFQSPGKGDGERVSHAGEAGHMLDISERRSENFACALALQLGPSFLQAQGLIHSAGHVTVEVSSLQVCLVTSTSNDAFAEGIISQCFTSIHIS